jgi:hypothetical protein
MRTCIRETLNGDYSIARLQISDSERAGSGHCPINVHRARATLGNTATVFGSGEPDLFANNPQQWRLGLYVDLVDFTIDVERYHGFAFRMQPAE